MLKKYVLLLSIIIVPVFFCSAQRIGDTVSDRQFWLDHLDKLARPVLTNLAKDELKKNMPVQVSKRADNSPNRKKVAYLEAFSRLLSGIGPWLNLEGGSVKEQTLRNEYRQLVLKSISNAVNPAAKDYMEWSVGGQPLVDASFMALGLMRCPWIWEHLDEVEEDARSQVTMIVLLVPGEEKSSLGNLEFSNPSPPLGII